MFLGGKGFTICVCIYIYNYIYIKGLRPLPPTPGGSCLCEKLGAPTDAGAGVQSVLRRLPFCALLWQQTI